MQKFLLAEKENCSLDKSTSFPFLIKSKNKMFKPETLNLIPLASMSQRHCLFFMNNKHKPVGNKCQNKTTQKTSNLF